MDIIIKRSFRSFLVILTASLMTTTASFGCFAVIAGKDATADGSVLFGHLEQNGGIRNMSYFYVPRIRHDSDSYTELIRGGKWPQPEETFAYLWGKNTGVEFGDGYFNEWGVAIASDACPSRQDSYDDLAERGEITDGGIGFKLRRIVARQARTAREGVKIAGELVDHFGYATSGRTYIIADASEAWLFSAVKGKNWIAQRVPDDQVVLLPNVYITGPEADLNDTANVLASEGLVEYAISRGWYDPGSGKPFSFRDSFSAEAAAGSFMKENGVDPRQWFSQSLIYGELIGLPARVQLPFSVKPGRKLTVRDVANILRSHGHVDGQEPNMDLGHLLGISEEITPHKQGGTGNICSGRSQELVVYQLRNWLPVEVGSLAWRTTSAPCGSAMVPWYCGINETPKPYRKEWDVHEAMNPAFHFSPPERTYDFDHGNAFDIFKALEDLIDLNYYENISYARELWNPFEQDQFDLQPAVERVALELIESDRELAVKFLTGYTGFRANKALETAREMVSHFRSTNP